MKFKLFLLSLTIFTAGQALPANAQHAQEGQSRWSFEPNHWGSAKMPKPRYVNTVPHAVTAGAMPHIGSYLGIDPSLLKRPAPAPQVQQQLQAIASIPHVQAAPFRNDFGAPINEQQAHPNQIAQSQLPATKPMSQSHGGSNAHVQGTLRHVPRGSAIAQGSSLPQIQSYGGQGYSPGAFQAGSGASSHTDTQLSGRIIRH